MKGERTMRRVLAPVVLLTDDGGENTKARTHDAFSGHLESSRGGHSNFGRLTSTALPIVGPTGRANPWAEAKGQGCDTTVILAYWPEESKGQNDVPQLQDRLPQVWKDSQGPTALPLLPMPQDVF